jgi:hypothetical protein
LVSLSFVSSAFAGCDGDCGDGGGSVTGPGGGGNYSSEYYKYYSIPLDEFYSMNRLLALWRSMQNNPR